MTIKEKVTTKGGNIGYKMTRSRYIKGKDGYGAVITVARENLIKANGGKDPGTNVVAAHANFGAHNGKDQKAKWASRAWNTAESNMNRADGISASDKLKLKNYQAPKTKRNLKEIVKKKNGAS